MFENEISKYLNRHGFGAFHPKAVLFDMDGVLYDSMPNHAVSWHEAMEHYGLVMPPEDAYKYEGMRGVETIRLLAREQWHRELTEEEAAKMYAVKAERFRSCPPPRQMPGVVRLMHAIADSHRKIGVVTGSGQASLIDQLTSAFDGLIAPDCIVTSFDVTHGKPNPEPYLRGMEKAGIAPYEGIVVENAPLGVRAAVAARLFTVAVNTGPLPDSMLWDEGADLVFPNMDAFADAWPTLIGEIKLGEAE